MLGDLLVTLSTASKAEAARLAHYAVLGSRAVCSCIDGFEQLFESSRAELIISHEQVAFFAAVLMILRRFVDPEKRSRDESGREWRRYQGHAKAR